MASSTIHRHAGMHAGLSTAKSSGDVMNRMEMLLGQGSLNESGIEMSYKRKETLREMSACLSYRRQAKHRIDQFEKRPSELENASVSWFSGMRFWAKQTYQRSIGKVLEKGNYYSLWASSLKSIEGSYGSGIGTYFRFLRFLLGLNCLALIISLSFIFVPQVLDRCFDNGTAISDPYSGSVRFEDFITGNGWLKDTELFYGFYTSKLLNTFPDLAEYNMSEAYYYTMFTSYLLTLLILAVSLATSYRKNFIENEGLDGKNDFCNRIFGSWDFATSQAKSMKLQSDSLLTQIRETLDRRRTGEKSEIAKSHIFLKVMLTIIINLLVIGVLIGIGFLTNFLIDQFGHENESHFWAQMYLSLTLTGVMLVVPYLFALLSLAETHISVRTKIYVNLTRTVLLEAVVLGMVVVKYLALHSAGQQEDEGFCWETRIGQEMYRFLLVFFFVLVISTFLLETMHRLLYTKARFTWLGTPEFDVARNTMHLIYAQTVVWLGHYFSPLLPVIVAMILIITFYIKQGGLKLNSSSVSRRPWRAAQSNTIFLAFSFLSCIGACVAVCFVIIRVHPSGSCGPFRHLENSYPYEIMVKAKFFSSFIFKPSVVVAIIVGLCVAVIYVRALAIASKQNVDILSKRIRTEGTEKTFLIKLMQTMAQDHRINK